VGGERLTKLVDANGNATSWEYDLQGRVVEETRADGSSETYTYEATSSRLKQKTDRKNITTTFEYFLDGKLKRKSYSDTTPAVNYTYDAVDGLMLTAANGTDTLTTPSTASRRRRARRTPPLSATATTVRETGRPSASTARRTSAAATTSGAA